MFLSLGFNNIRTILEIMEKANYALCIKNKCYKCSIYFKECGTLSCLMVVPCFTLPSSFCKFACEVFKLAMWMRLWGGTSPKRTVLVGNSALIGNLSTAKLVKKLHPSTVQTAVTYVDSAGCQRYKGTPALKSTQ